jgi:hypothetical protein
VIQSSYNTVIQYPRITILREPEFTVDINLVQLQGVPELLTFIHLDITDFKPSVLRKLLLLWETVVKPKLPKDTFCHGEVSDHKFTKFVTRFGFVEIVVSMCTDGTPRPIYCYFKK